MEKAGIFGYTSVFSLVLELPIVIATATSPAM
jgi:hypothetical protein